MTGSASSLGAVVWCVIILSVRKLCLLFVKVTCLSLLWLYPLPEWGRVFPRSTAPALGREEVAPRAAQPDVLSRDDVPGLGSPLSRAEGTEQDNMLNSHIKKKKSRCLLMPRGMVTTDLCV